MLETAIMNNWKGVYPIKDDTTNDMPEDVRRKILNLCIEVEKEDYKALYELLTNGNKSVLSISLEYHLSEKKLYYMRKNFYEKW